MTKQISEMQSRRIVRYSNESAKQITCECIESALIQLLETNEFDKITISDLVKQAGVSRTAFYRHYDSKEAVLDNLLDSVFKEVKEVLDGDAFFKTPDVFWRQQLVIVKKHLRPFQLLLKAGLGGRILDQITRFTMSGSSGETAEDYYNDVFWSGAVYNVLIHWVRSDADIPVEELADICVAIRDKITK